MLGVLGSWAHPLMSPLCREHAVVQYVLSFLALGVFSQQCSPGHGWSFSCLPLRLLFLREVPSVVLLWCCLLSCVVLDGIASLNWLGCCFGLFSFTKVGGMFVSQLDFAAAEISLNLEFHVQPSLSSVNLLPVRRKIQDWTEEHKPSHLLKSLTVEQFWFHSGLFSHWIISVSRVGMDKIIHRRNWIIYDDL